MLKKFLFTVALTVAPLATFADAPVCPASSSLKTVIFAMPTSPNLGGGWSAVSDDMGGVWQNVLVRMYDSDITSSSIALTRARAIQKTANSVVESKVYLDPLKHNGSYFWACDYNIDHKYLPVGDFTSLFSQNYNNSGMLSSQQLSSTEKVRLFKQQEGH